MMKKDWPTRDYDLKTAADIISRYVELNEGEPIGLLHIAVAEDEIADVQISDWLMELAEHYYMLYGRERGERVTELILARCITSGHAIH